MSTGFPVSDARDDFTRLRRARVLARLRRRLRGESGDVDLILPFEEVVAALGRLGEQRLGLREVPVDAIVGTVDRTTDFDRRFRPTSGRPRDRFERIALAMRRGESMPPISVYQVGEVYFVRDGHHRVSAARALARATIDAEVTLVRTQVGAGGDLRASDLPLKGHERVFFERVPLRGEQRTRIRLTDPTRYDELAEGVEAWGFRVMQDRETWLDRSTVAERWFTEEYDPVVGMLREAELLGPGTTDTESYMRIAGLRFRLLRSHTWDHDTIALLARHAPGRGVSG